MTDAVCDDVGIGSQPDASGLTVQAKTVKRGLEAIRGRWHAWRRRDELDDLLIAGVEPAAAPELRARAAQLTRANGRYRLAATLESIAATRNDAAVSPVGPDLPGARDVSPPLLELASLLREADAWTARDVAMFRRFVYPRPSRNAEPGRAVRPASAPRPPIAPPDRLPPRSPMAPPDRLGPGPLWAPPAPAPPAAWLGDQTVTPSGGSPG